MQVRQMLQWPMHEAPSSQAVKLMVLDFSPLTGGLVLASTAWVSPPESACCAYVQAPKASCTSELSGELISQEALMRQASTLSSEYGTPWRWFLCSLGVRLGRPLQTSRDLLALGHVALIWRLAWGLRVGPAGFHTSLLPLGLGRHRDGASPPATPSGLSEDCCP